MFKKNQSDWNLSINSFMYSCATRKAGTNRTPMMEQIARMVNGYVGGYYCLGPCLIWFISSSCATPSKMECFAQVVGGFQCFTVFTEGSVFVVLLVLAASQMLFIQRLYFILAKERLIFYSVLLLRIVLTTVTPRFHGYHYQTCQILNFIVTEYCFTLIMISGERDRNISS